MLSIKNEQGYTLISVLLVVLLLTILGGAYFFAMNFEVHQSFRHDDRIQAYYFARSGAEAGFFWLENEGYLDGIKELDKDNTYFEGSLQQFSFKEEFSGEEPIEVIIMRDENQIRIEATGRIREKNIQEKTSLVLARQDGSFAPFDMAFFATRSGNNVVDLNSNATIIGPAGTNSINVGAASFSPNARLRQNGDEGGANFYIGPGGDPESVVDFFWSPGTHLPDGEVKNLPTLREYPQVEFADFPVFNDVTTIIDDRIDSNGFYGDISYGGNDTLTIEVGNNDRIIRASSFSLGGNADVIIDRTGNGRVLLYIEDDFSLGGNSTINNDGDKEDLTIFHKGTNAISLASNVRVVGSVKIESADLNLTGNNQIMGHIVSGGDFIEIDGNAKGFGRVVYAPNAHVEIGGNGDFLGSIISQSIEIHGNGEVSFSKPDLTTVPEGFLPDNFLDEDYDSGIFDIYRWE